MDQIDPRSFAMTIYWWTSSWMLTNCCSSPAPDSPHWQLILHMMEYLGVERLSEDICGTLLGVYKGHLDVYTLDMRSEVVVLQGDMIRPQTYLCRRCEGNGPFFVSKNTVHIKYWSGHFWSSRTEAKIADSLIEKFKLRDNILYCLGEGYLIRLWCDQGNFCVKLDVPYDGISKVGDDESGLVVDQWQVVWSWHQRRTQLLSFCWISIQLLYLMCPSSTYISYWLISGGTALGWR